MEVYLKNNIDCPEVYGDPALLLSHYYRPHICKMYKLGIVLHYSDDTNIIVKEIKENYPEILVIHMRGYDHWHDIPDKICSCEKIISSSLHGLIISDSYGIPNVWITFPNKSKDYFKYFDYFASVDRDDNYPIEIKSIKDIEYIIEKKSFNLARYINFKEILDSCPFKDNLKECIYKI